MASPGDFDLSDFLPYRLSVVTNRVSQAFARRYADAYGLAIPEWRVMAVLGGHPPLSAGEDCAARGYPVVAGDEAARAGPGSAESFVCCRASQRDQIERTRSM